MRPRDIVRAVKRARHNVNMRRRPRGGERSWKRLAYWRRADVCVCDGRACDCARDARAHHRAFLERGGYLRPRKRSRGKPGAPSRGQRAFVRAGLPAFAPLGVAVALRLERERPGVPYRQAFEDELMADI